MGALSATTLANDGRPGTVPELIDPNPNASPGALALEGTEWRLVKAQLSGTYGDIPPEVVATLHMADGRAGGSGGCNQWFADYALDGQGLAFGTIGSTMMYCEGPGGQVETFFLADLEAVRSWDITDATLTLSSDLGPVLAFVSSGASAALDGDWTIIAYNDGQGALVGIDDDSAQLTIADGRISATVGCNRIFGSMSQDGTAIAVSQLGSTQMYCEGLMDREQAVMASLMASTQVRSEDGGLVLLDAAGTVQLHLVPDTLAGVEPSTGPSQPGDTPVSQPGDTPVSQPGDTPVSSPAA